MTYHRSNLGPSSPPEEVAGHIHKNGQGCPRNKTCEEEKRRAERCRCRRRQRGHFSAEAARRAAKDVTTPTTTQWRRTERYGRSRGSFQLAI
eukprot:7780277-Heterocapsa_arctica.AAC.1